MKIKLSDSEVPNVVRKLEELGFRRVREVVEEDIYFNYSKDLRAIRDFVKRDEALRLRKEDGKARLTYKGPREGGKVKAREEIEVSVDDPNAMIAILERVGFEVAASVVKRRVEFTSKEGNVKVCLDEVKDLGTFLEVEVINGSEEDVLKIVEQLGLKGRQLLAKSYLEMLLGLSAAQ